ncbi:MAG: YkgJ family cysteine cluster protein [bacterium]
MSSLVEQKDSILEAFKCQGSGNCCRCPGYVYVTDQELENMAKILDMNPADFRQQYTKTRSGWTLVSDPRFRPACFLNDQQRCKVYDARPKACRSYPDWPSIWKDDASVIHESTLCPGLKQAIDVHVS